MIQSRSLLKGVAAELSVLAALSLPAGANPFPGRHAKQFDAHTRMLAPVETGHPMNPADAGEIYKKTIGYDGKEKGENLANTAELLRLSFGTWPAPGVAYDPDIVLQTPAFLELNFTSDQPKKVSAATNGPDSFPSEGRDILDPSYQRADGIFYATPQIEGDLFPLDTPYHIAADISMTGHETVHAIFNERDLLLDLLTTPQTLDDISQSRVRGHGPDLEKILADNETPEQTAARHQHLEDFYHGKAGDHDDNLKEYPLLYTELRSYLHQTLARAISTHAWDRLPATKEELWAACLNNFSGMVFDGEGKDEVSKFLVSPAGTKALKEFSVVPYEESRTVFRQDLLQLKDASDVEFYEKVLPALYGELLEAYGDPNGKVKMGLPASPNYGIAFAYHVLHAGEGGPQVWTDKQWKAVAAKVEPEVFERVCELAIAHHNPDALAALLQTPAGRALTKEQKAVLLQGAYNEIPQATDANQVAARHVQVILEKTGADTKDLPAPSKEEAAPSAVPVSQNGLAGSSFQRAPSSAPLQEQGLVAHK